MDLIWYGPDHLHLSLHLCILHDVLVTSFREWNLLGFLNFLHCLCVAVFGHCISAGTSTFMSMYCCCETSVIYLLYLLDDLVDVLHLWQLQRSLHLVVDPVDVLHLVNIVSLHTESGES